MRASNWLNAAIAAALTMNVDLVAGFWRLPCRGRSGAARVDPLMSPGQISQHVHVVAGGKSKPRLQMVCSFSSLYRYHYEGDSLG